MYRKTPDSVLIPNCLYLPSIAKRTGLGKRNFVVSIRSGDMVRLPNMKHLCAFPDCIQRASQLLCVLPAVAIFRRFYTEGLLAGKADKESIRAETILRQYDKTRLNSRLKETKILKISPMTSKAPQIQK